MFSPRYTPTTPGHKLTSAPFVLTYKTMRCTPNKMDNKNGRNMEIMLLKKLEKN